MDIILWILAVFVGVYAIALLVVTIKQKRFFKTTFIWAITGLVLMLVINLTSPFSGINIPSNPWTVGCSAAGGVPGVIMILMFRTIFKS